MSEGRQPTVTAVCGMQGVGKTTALLSFINNWVLQKGVLIYDYSSEPKYRNFRQINIEDLPRWKHKGIYRVYHPEPDYFFEMVRLHVRNCYLILEDARSYMNANLQSEIASVFGIRRQLGIDIVANFWALENVPPTVLTYANYITIFKTRDKLQKLEKLDKVPNLEDVIEVWQEVQKNPNKHYFLTVRTNG